MKSAISLWILLSLSSICLARGGGYDDPLPFPLATELIGQWKNPEADQVLRISTVDAPGKMKEALFVEIQEGGRQHSEGYLYPQGDKYCGIMHRARKAIYNLCVWKEDDQLKSLTYAGKEWSAVRAYE
jgi:hypothetical protein